MTPFFTALTSETIPDDIIPSPEFVTCHPSLMKASIALLRCSGFTRRSASLMGLPPGNG